MFRHSQDGELAVGVSLDNRLRLYDAVRGLECLPVPFLCLRSAIINPTPDPMACPIQRIAPDVHLWHAAHTQIHTQTTGAIRQKYVEKDHLAFRYTCLDWLRGLAWNDKVSHGRRPCRCGSDGGGVALAFGCNCRAVESLVGTFDKMRKLFFAFNWSVLLNQPCEKQKL